MKLGRRRRRLLNAKSRILATAEPAASPSPVSASLSLAQCQWPAATRRPRAGPPLTLALITYITGSLRQLPSSRACTAVCTAGLKRPWGHPSKQPGGLGHWRLHTRQITCQSAVAQVRRLRVSPDRPTEREGMAWHGMAATANLGRSAKSVAAAMRARDGTTHTVTLATR